jgi:hypothetical protein
MNFNQSIEGYNFNDAQWGTPNAQPVILEFWAFSTLTGTFGGSVRNAASNRSYVFTFNIPTASTWTKFRISIPGDTVGTWSAANNAPTASLTFNIGCGANAQSAPGVWAAGNFLAAPGAVNVLGTVNANLLITGVALMVGAAAQNAEPEFKKFSDNLIDCQRYFEFGLLWMQSPGAAAFGAPLNFKVSKRVAPTSIAFQNITYVTASGLAAQFLSAQGFNAQVGASAANGSVSAGWTVDVDF